MMKGLILHQLYMSKMRPRTWAQTLFAVLLYGRMTSIPMMNEISVLLPYCVAVVFIGSLGNTESGEHWDRFCHTLPLRQPEVLLARYIGALLSAWPAPAMALLSALIVHAPHVNFSPERLLFAFPFGAIILLLSHAIFHPVALHAGSDTARIFLWFIVPAYLFLYGIARWTMERHPWPTVDAFLAWFGALGLAFSLLSLAVSYRISLQLVKKKQM